MKVDSLNHQTGSFVRGFGPLSPTSKFDAWLNQIKEHEIIHKATRSHKKIIKMIGYKKRTIR